MDIDQLRKEVDTLGINAVSKKYKLKKAKIRALIDNKNNIDDGHTASNTSKSDITKKDITIDTTKNGITNNISKSDILKKNITSHIAKKDITSNITKKSITNHISKKDITINTSDNNITKDNIDMNKLKLLIDNADAILKLIKKNELKITDQTTITTTLRINKELYEMVKSHSKKNKITITNIINEAIIQYLEEN